MCPEWNGSLALLCICVSAHSRYEAGATSFFLTEALLNQFKDKKKADAGLATVMSTSEQLQKTIDTAGISSQVSADWSRVQTSLDTLAKEFNVTKAAAAPK